MIWRLNSVWPLLGQNPSQHARPWFDRLWNGLEKIISVKANGLEENESWQSHDVG